MVPWCNRVSAGRVEGSASRPVLVPNWPTTPFPVHGFGWLDLSQVDSRTAKGVRLVHVRHDPEAYSYRTVLDITLLPDGAEFRLVCTNTGDEGLPFGIGLHPYLPRTIDSVLTVRGGTRVAFDPRGLPVGERAVDGEDDLRNGRTLPKSTFSALYPDCTEAEVAGPRSTLRLAAGGAFRHLLVWAPEGRDFVCIEPMSHRVDAFSARASAAPHDLAPGATICGTMTLRVQ
jgi:aldose 1-epimerase